MSQDVNKQILVGHIGNEPVERIVSDDLIVVTFSVATSRSWVNKDTGEVENATDWHNIVLFNDSAQRAMNLLKKGSQVYVEGSSRTQHWEKEGQTHYMTQIHPSFWKVLGPAPALESNKLNGQHQASAPASAFKATDADIPF